MPVDHVCGRLSPDIHDVTLRASVLEEPEHRDAQVGVCLCALFVSSSGVSGVPDKVLEELIGAGHQARRFACNGRFGCPGAWPTKPAVLVPTPAIGGAPSRTSWILTPGRLVKLADMSFETSFKALT